MGRKKSKKLITKIKRKRSFKLSLKASKIQRQVYNSELTELTELYKEEGVHDSLE